MRTHDTSTCHACAVIALRHAAGGTLDPNATARPGDKLRAVPRVSLPDAAYRALDRKLEALALRDAVVRALDGASSSGVHRLPAVEDVERLEVDLRVAELNRAADRIFGV